MADPRIVILGAGPTGLGAAWRLKELGYTNWDIYEKNNYVGGLATSFTDDHGFTYDIGGHVIFSHYEYFDNLLDTLLGDEWEEHSRQAWIWIADRYVPYPFQNNLGYVPKEMLLDCLLGLYRISVNGNGKGINGSHGSNGNGSSSDGLNGNGTQDFKSWIETTLGDGIGKHFMEPYNFKVWACPPERMSAQWIAERVSVVDFEKLLRNVIIGKEDSRWGPNNTFRYPRRGGTGAIYQAMRPVVEDHLHLEHQVERIDPQAKRVRFANGTETDYDCLISTVPLDLLVPMLTTCPEEVREAATQLEHNSSVIAGIGVRGDPPSDKNWIYYPQEDVPFYRLTYLSNYAASMAPEGHYLLLTETSHSQWKPINRETLAEEIIDGLIATQSFPAKDRKNIVTVKLIESDHEYPIPTLGRDPALAVLQPFLEDQHILSRGRFGAWLYEIGNMDHSVMQGVEAANRILHGEPETVWIPPAKGAVRT